LLLHQAIDSGSAQGQDLRHLLYRQQSLLGFGWLDIQYQQGWFPPDGSFDQRYLAGDWRSHGFQEFRLRRWKSNRQRDDGIASDFVLSLGSSAYESQGRR